MQQETVFNLPAQRINLIIFILMALSPLVGMGVDLLSPSLPAISRELHVSNAFSKNLIAIYLFGYVIGNFLIGFLSDTIGRRKLVVIGLLLFTLASLLPTVYANPSMLLSARFLQGFSLATFAVNNRAILADILLPEKLIHIAPLLATMWGIGPIIGPLIGGYLQYYFNWPACFYFFAGYGFLGFLALFFLMPETHFNRQKLNLSVLSHNFSTIITNRLFLGLGFILGLNYSLLIAFNTLGPFLIQNVLGHSPVYFGHVALYLGLIFLGGTILCRRLVKQFRTETILWVAIPIFLAIAIIGLGFTYIDSKNMMIIIALSLLMFLGCGIVYPSCMGKSISLFRHIAGSGSAIISMINLTITSMTAFLMSFVNAGSAIPLAWMYFGLILLSGLSYWFLVRAKNQKPNVSE